MWRTIKSVLAAFFGVQKDERRRQDFERGRPGSFIVVGLLMGLGLVVLIAIVATIAAR